jgi:hypothetical protein
MEWPDVDRVSGEDTTMPVPRRDLRARFWLETVLAAFTLVLSVVTLFWAEWIEAFGFDPDHGDGSAERRIALGLVAVSLLLGIAARGDWRRPAAARLAAEG